jgi:hypothetical protein
MSSPSPQPVASCAALIIANDGADITADKLQCIISTTNVDAIDPVWLNVFTKAVEGNDAKEIICEMNKGSTPAVGSPACEFIRITRKCSNLTTCAVVSTEYIAAPRSLREGSNRSPSELDVQVR